MYQLMTAEKMLAMHRHSSHARSYLILPKYDFFFKRVIYSRSSGDASERLQDIFVLLEAQLHPLVQAESSVIVDVLYRPEYLFQPGTEARKKCDNGGFIRRLIKHTERLLEIKRKNFASRSSTRCARCDVHNGEKVFQVIFKVNELHKLTYYFPQKQGDTLRKNLLGALFCQTGLS
jgi:hypothetical protein